MNVSHALELMRTHQIRRLPVVNDKHGSLPLLDWGFYAEDGSASYYIFLLILITLPLPLSFDDGDRLQSRNFPADAQSVDHFNHVRYVLVGHGAANLANKTAHASTSPSSFMPTANPQAYRCSTMSALPNHWASD